MLTIDELKAVWNLITRANLPIMASEARAVALIQQRVAQTIQELQNGNSPNPAE